MIFSKEKNLDRIVRLPYNSVIMNSVKKSLAQLDQKKFHSMNDILVSISKIYMQWHDEEQDFGIGETLCRAEIHTVQAIGNNEGINVTQLANMLEVTKPTISEKIKKLSGLGLISKQKNANNNKEIQLFLTSKGWEAYDNHEKKHESLYGLFKDHFGDEGSVFLESFTKDLCKFLEFLRKIKKV